jgi:multiple antibiotic resistance protein
MSVLAFATLAFTTFITLINPLSLMPIYLTMTSDLEPADKKAVAKKATLTAFITLLVFAFGGQFIFNFFNITTDGLRVAGGIIFFVMGYDMLRARITRIKVKKSEVKQYTGDISITPLGIPMICGPGAITSSILLMKDATTVELKATLVGVILIICIITLISMFSAERFNKILGQTGNNVLMRIMGLILMVIAVETFFAGLKPIVQGIIFRV